MKERKMTPKHLLRFEIYLQEEERSPATVEKYMRDVKAFYAFVGEGHIQKTSVMAYKNQLAEKYAISSANSMIAAVNSFLKFCGWHDLCIKRFKVQRVAFASEDRELSREEYLKLLSTARSQGKERLCLILQTICATGIRVSELQYITVEAARRGEAQVCCKGKNRRIFIIPKLKKKLLQYAKAHHIRSGAIFVGKGGKIISRHHIWREMKSLCTHAQISPLKVFPHNLRHLFAKTFYAMEKDIAKLADILGHASINTTRIYIMTSSAEHKRQMTHMHLVI